MVLGFGDFFELRRVSKWPVFEMCRCDCIARSVTLRTRQAEGFLCFPS